MIPPRLAYYCCQCNAVFYSTSDDPDACSRCGATNWYELKRHRHASRFDPEAYEE